MKIRSVVPTQKKLFWYHKLQRSLIDFSCSLNFFGNLVFLKYLCTEVYNRFVYCSLYCTMYVCVSGPGSSVGAATDYGLDGPGIKIRCGWDSPPIQTSPGAHPASCTMCTGSFPGVESGRGVLLTTHPLLAPRSWKSRAVPLPTLWACNGVTLPTNVCLSPRRCILLLSLRPSQ
jgi:hypothetical protein